MSKLTCHNCGKDMGEEKPYDQNLELLSTCKKCKAALEKVWERKQLVKTSAFMMAGGATL